MTPRLLLRMTRPGFLSITVVACLLGFASAAPTACAVSLPMMLAITALAVLAHAAANVVNDYYDFLNGGDDQNDTAIAPFTGGARLIQHRIVSAAATRRLAGILFAAAAVAGLTILPRPDAMLIAIGGTGLLLAWGYSAPPLRLMTRGLGETAVSAAWMLVVAGAAIAVCPAAAGTAMRSSLGFGLMLANILLVNEFPDAAADARVGKRTLVVRLGPPASARLVTLLVIMAHGLPWLWIWSGRLPSGVALSALSLPLALSGARALARDLDRPRMLRPAIVRTIAAAHLYGLTLGAGLLLG
ncbi:MAG: prenyltransferase [Burkholderiaceae bacterium]